MNSSAGKIQFVCRREKLLGRDRGVFFLDWYNNESENDLLAQDVPILLILHGINGGSAEGTVQQLGLSVSKKLGWRTGCILFRGCYGTELTTLRTYHAGYTEDLHVALTEISRQFPNAPIALAGFSLGANVIAKYLGERNSSYTPRIHYDHIVKHEPIPSNVYAAVCVCTTFDCVKVRATVPRKVSEHVAKRMCQYCRRHSSILGQLPTYRALWNLRNPTYDLVDTYITMHMFGYDVVDDAYNDTSAVLYLEGIGPHTERVPVPVSPAQILRPLPPSRLVPPPSPAHSTAISLACSAQPYADTAFGAAYSTTAATSISSLMSPSVSVSGSLSFPSSSSSSSLSSSFPFGSSPLAGTQMSGEDEKREDEMLKGPAPEDIRVLFIHSLNDPMNGVSPFLLDKIEANPNTAMLAFPGGGHLGFFSLFSRTRRQDHVFAVRFLQYELKRVKSTTTRTGGGEG